MLLLCVPTYRSQSTSGFLRVGSPAALSTWCRTLAQEHQFVWEGQPGANNGPNCAWSLIISLHDCSSSVLRWPWNHQQDCVQIGFEGYHSPLCLFEWVIVWLDHEGWAWKWNMNACLIADHSVLWFLKSNLNGDRSISRRNWESYVVLSHGRPVPCDQSITDINKKKTSAVPGNRKQKFSWSELCLR